MMRRTRHSGSGACDVSRKRPSLPGAHRVTKKLASGGLAIYWYSCRGGALLKRFEGSTPAAASRAEHEGAAELAAAFALRRSRPEPAKLRMSDLVEAYKKAPDGLLRLRDSTRAEWSRWLDEIVREFGDMPLKALGAKGVGATFIKWRNGRASTPRAADYGVQVLRRLLAWGVKNELADHNPAEGIEGIYKASRADIIVEPGELEAIIKHVTPEAGRLFRLAAATGIRRGDLVQLKWSDVREHSIEFGTAKSGGMQRPLMPLWPEARAVIDELREERDRLIASGKIPSAFLLTTQKGTPWKEDSATQAFWRAAKDLGIDKNLHDLRGTAVTRFVLAGLSEEVVADLVGWEPARVRQVRKRYVHRDRIALGIIEQLQPGATSKEDQLVGEQR